MPRTGSTAGAQGEKMPAFVVTQKAPTHDIAAHATSRLKLKTSGIENARTLRSGRFHRVAWYAVGREGTPRPEAARKAVQASLPKVSTATVTRAVIGASVCSVSLIDASVSLFDSAIAFSSAALAKLLCRSMASFTDFAVLIALKVETDSSNEAFAEVAICFVSSCTPALQIWPDLTNASRFAWPNATKSSVLFIMVFIPWITLGVRVSLVGLIDAAVSTTSAVTAAMVSAVAVMDFETT